MINNFIGSNVLPHNSGRNSQSRIVRDIQLFLIKKRTFWGGKGKKNTIPCKYILQGIRPIGEIAKCPPAMTCSGCKQHRHTAKHG
jgi:hypothetical protein